MTPFAEKVIELARTQVGVREHGRNRGPEIDGYCRDVPWDPERRDPWCAIFVSSMVKRAADAMGVPVPIHLTPGVWTLDEKAPPWMRTLHPVAGSIFIVAGHKHTGFVSDVAEDGTIHTIEGNTNPGGSAEGDGVYARTRRRSELMGFIDLNAEPPASAA
jgi:hypothetical protein